MAKKKDVPARLQGIPKETAPLKLTAQEEEFKERHDTTDTGAKAAIAKINTNAAIEKIKDEIKKAKSVAAEEVEYIYFKKGAKGMLYGSVSEDIEFDEIKFLIELNGFSKKSGMTIQRSDISIKCGVYVFLIFMESTMMKNLFSHIYFTNDQDINAFSIKG